MVSTQDIFVTLPVSYKVRYSLPSETTKSPEWKEFPYDVKLVIGQELFDNVFMGIAWKRDTFLVSIKKRNDIYIYCQKGKTLLESKLIESKCCTEWKYS
jgi:hypothetical protein